MVKLKNVVLQPIKFCIQHNIFCEKRENSGTDIYNSLLFDGCMDRSAVADNFNYPESKACHHLLLIEKDDISDLMEPFLLVSLFNGISTFVGYLMPELSL